MSKRIAILAAVLVLLTTACDSVGDGINRRTSARRTTTQTNTSSTSASSTTNGAPGTNPWQGPVPTAIHYPSQCPGATNAEIDAALQSNRPWVCYAATREAAGQ